MAEGVSKTEVRAQFILHGDGNQRRTVIGGLGHAGQQCAVRCRPRWYIAINFQCNALEDIFYAVIKRVQHGRQGGCFDKSGVFFGESIENKGVGCEQLIDVGAIYCYLFLDVRPHGKVVLLVLDGL